MNFKEYLALELKNYELSNEELDMMLKEYEYDNDIMDIEYTTAE